MNGKVFLAAVMGIGLAIAMLAPAATADEARVLRTPTIHGDSIVFTFAGDLYTVASKGGTARRLTSHDGFEAFARFSPDGKWIAFCGEYDGNREVYRIPAEGGSPLRLTYTPTLGRDDISDRMGPNNLVMGWTPDGRDVVFRSRMREHNSFNGQLYLVDKNGGMARQVPLPRGGFCSYSPDGKKLAYNRIFREFRTWKRYRGGMADEIWIHDFETRETKAITDNGAQDIIPMWHGDKIYFLSDRDDKERMNLWVHDTKSGKNRRLTSFEEFDIKFPSIGKNAIVFEYGGYLYRFDLASEKAERVPVHINDDGASTRVETIEVGPSVTSFDLSPTGKRVVVGARGEVFSVPASKGYTRNLTQSSGVHERNATWSPDGKHIAFVSDRSGNDEIWVVPQDGSGEATKLTSTGDTYIYEIGWSPDSSKIAWTDKMLRLRYVDLESKQVVGVAQAKAWEIRGFSWSPDSRWLAWSQAENESMGRVYIHSLESRETTPVTDGWYASSGPDFSDDGKYLFFSSSRDFNPIYSSTEWNHAYQDMSRLYFVTLAKDTPSPFAPELDEAVVEEDDEAEEGEGDDEKKSEDAGAKKDDDDAITIDVDGIADRILVLPGQTGNYSGITAVDGRVFYFHSRSNDPSARGLYVFDMKSEKATKVGQYNGYAISSDNKKMLLRSGSRLGIVDLPRGAVTLKDTVDLSNLQMRLDRKAEWAQIYHECWRQMRDFFFAPNMHGVNWDMMRQRYAPLAESVHHRYDLTYVIGELIGELNVGHAYVGGGDAPSVDKSMRVGMLGGQVEKDADSGFFRITKILRGENWNSATRSPLATLGVNAEVGDYITAVNGNSTKDMTNLYESLVGTVGDPVVLSLSKSNSGDDARDVIIEPIRDELSLYYYNWVQDNIDKVTEATDGRVGYLHIPDMGVNGLNEFVKHYYPQLRKEALIIDVRGNGGGNVSPMLIERLLRTPVFFDMARNTAKGTDPSEVFLGPKVCLINQFSASDGDIFPYRFKAMELGPLIGMRSWGGVVGIRGSLPLVDGGTLNKPEFANYSLDGKEWVIEGYGVDPDIEIENDPAKEYDGIDEQLNKAIEVVLEKLEKGEGMQIPDPPAWPQKG